MNATEAATRAGYSPKSARQEGTRLLSNASILDAIAELMQAVGEVPDPADMVLSEIARLAFANQMDYMRVVDGGDPYL